MMTSELDVTLLTAALHSNLHPFYTSLMKGPTHIQTAQSPPLDITAMTHTSRMTSEKKGAAESGGMKSISLFFECP